MKTMGVVLAICVCMLSGCQSLSFSDIAKNQEQVPWREVKPSDLELTFPRGDFTMEIAVSFFDEEYPRGIIVGIGRSNSSISELVFNLNYVESNNKTGTAQRLAPKPSPPLSFPAGKPLIITVSRTGTNVKTTLAILPDTGLPVAAELQGVPVAEFASSPDALMPRLFVVGHGDVQLRIIKTAPKWQKGSAVLIARL
jgi:hypothetical protein